MGNTSRIIRLLTNVIGIPLVIIWLVLAYFEIQPEQEEAIESQSVFESTDATGGYAVSAAHPKAADVAQDILAQGGNAYDAAIAISFALGVVEPYGSGIGGGGAMIVYDPTKPEDEEISYIDYREVAPKSLVTPSMVADALGFETESGEVPTIEEWQDIRRIVSERLNAEATDNGETDPATAAAEEEDHPYAHVIDYLVEQPDMVVGNDILIDAVESAGEVEDFLGTPTPRLDEETGEWLTGEEEDETGPQTEEVPVEEPAVDEDETDQASALTEAETDLLSMLESLEATPQEWGNRHYMEDFGIPGFLKGMDYLFENHASYSMEELLKPAIDLASPGEDFSGDEADFNTVLADQYLQDRFNFAQNRLSPSDIPHFYPNNMRITRDQELVQVELAQTMNDIIDTGSFEQFFLEELAPEMVEAYPLLSMDDFEDYAIITDREPSTGNFDRYDIYSAPEPLGGPVLIQALELAEYMGTDQHAVAERMFESPIRQAESGTALELEEDNGSEDDNAEGDFETGQSEEAIIADIESYIDYMEKIIGINFVTYQDRLSNIGDPLTSERARERGGENLTSDEKIEELYENWLIEQEDREERREFEDSDSPDEEESGTEVFHNQDSEGLMASADSFFDARSEIDNHVNTSHFVIIDREGRMITSTHTLSNFFGSGEYFKGFFLNDQLSNFSETIGSINEPYPERRPRSFMTPTLFVERDENDNLIEMIGIGSPGGARIPMMISQVMIHHRQYDMEFTEAIERMPRFQYSYNESNDQYEIRLEPVFRAYGESIYDRIVTELDARGHNPGTETLGMYFGAVQALRMNLQENDISGFADPRRGGTTRADDEASETQQEDDDEEEDAMEGDAP